MILRTDLPADELLAASRDIALPGRRAIGAEQILAQFPGGRRGRLATPPDYVLRHALADDGAGGLPGFRAVTIQRLLQFGPQTQRFWHGESPCDTNYFYRITFLVATGAAGLDISVCNLIGSPFLVSGCDEAAGGVDRRSDPAQVSDVVWQRRLGAAAQS